MLFLLCMIDSFTVHINDQAFFLYLGKDYKFNPVNKRKMFEQIKNLMEKISFHQAQHKITIFNRQKNTKNTLEHNQAIGKLIQQLKKFQYFHQLNQNLGVQYLLQSLKYLQPHILRKDSILINNHQNLQSANSKQAIFTEYLLCDGIIAVYQNKPLSLQDQIQLPLNQHLGSQEQINKLKFKEYISSGNLISFSLYPEDQFQLVAYEDCSLLKLPSKKQLDPNKIYQKIQQINKTTTRNTQFYSIKDQLIKMTQEIKKHKKKQFDHTFALGQIDFNEFLSLSRIRKYQTHQKICQSGQQFKYMGLLLKGKVVSENIKQRTKKTVAHDNALLTFYKKDFSQEKNKLQKNQILLQEGQWIGIQQYLKHLEQNPFRVEKIIKKSSKQQSGLKQLIFFSANQYRVHQQCQILWVPITLFGKKMNYETNFSVLVNWQALNDLKFQIKQKSNKISQKINDKKPNQNLTDLSLPNLKQRFEKLSHHHPLQTITELRSKMLNQKRKNKPSRSLYQQIKVSQTSLLGVTMQNRLKLQTIKNQTLDFSFQLPKFRVFSHSLRSPKQKAMNQNMNIKSFSKKKQKNNHKSFSQKKMQPNSFQTFSQQKSRPQQDMIMYPEAYEPQKLSPDLRKQIFFAQKSFRLSALNYSPKNSQQSLKVDYGTSRLKNNGSQNQLLSHRLSSIGSKNSLDNSMISTPQSIYNKILSQISFKNSELEEKVRVQNFVKKRNQMAQKVGLKQRIQTLKVLGEIQRKKRVKESRQKKAQLFILPNFHNQTINH